MTSLAACHHESPTSPGPGGGGPSGQGLVATWRYTRAEYVSLSDSNLRIEVISHGTTMVITLSADGAYTQTITDPAQPPRTLGGTWAASVDVLTLRQTGRSGESQFDFTLNGNTLTIAGGHAEYDIDGNGVFEESVLSATLARQ